MRDRPMNFAQTVAGRTVMLAALLLLVLPLSGNSGCATTSVAKKSDSPEDPEGLFREAIERLDEAEASGRVDYKKFLASFLKVCDLSTEQSKPHAKACYNAGVAADKLGRRTQATELYQRARSADPTFQSAVQNLTVALVNTGRPEEAIPIYEEYLAQSPDDADMLNNYAGALAEAGRYDDGVQVIQKLLYKDSKNTRAYKTLARLYFLAGKYRMSQMASGNALKFTPDDADIHNNVALTFLKQGLEGEAVRKFKEALEKDETNLEANMNLGLIAVRAADYPTALECFKRVLDQDPGNEAALIGMAIAFRGNAEHDDAIAQYDLLLQADDCNSMAIKNKALVQFLFQKKTKDAIKTYGLHEKCHPNDDISGLIAKVQDQIAEEDRVAKQLAELERQMAELERQAREKTKLLATEIDRSRKVFVKYADLEQDPEFKVYLEDAIGNLQFAIESEDPFFMDDALQAMDDFMLYYYSALIDLETGEVLADPEEWTSRQPIELPPAATAPAEEAAGASSTEGEPTAEGPAAEASEASSETE